ncbi:MAG TPA: DNA polymerase domain-containing protein [Candidatus Limnocylindrales bacterium]
MANKAEMLEIAGREVAISNPGKIFFADKGYTKGDMVAYYMAVSDGALRGAGGRPMALKRFVNGAAGEFFFQKRAPESRPPWIETVELNFPSGRTADEIVLRDASQLAWIINLGCIDLNPHPVRAEDLDHPDELRVDLDPVPGVPWDDVRRVALVTRDVLEDVGLTGWPKTSGSRGIHINVRIKPEWTFDQVRRAALAIAREVERRAPEIATSKWWKEERHGVFLDYNQNAKDRTVASAYSIRPLPDARVSMPLRWEQVADVDPADYTLATVPAIYARDGDAHEGIDGAVGELNTLLDLSAEHERSGLGGDAPWPPNYRKQESEPPRVQPSRQRRATADYNTPEAEAAREKARVALERRFTAQAEARAAERAAGYGRAPSPTGRRVSTKPLVEIARAAKKDEAAAGLERWKSRHNDIVEYLQPADILTDSMRGRNTTWTRIRVNLEHVPAEMRPPQEPLEVDYDPWVEWSAPDRSGQLDRPTRKKPATEA